VTDKYCNKCQIKFFLGKCSNCGATVSLKKLSSPKPTLVPQKSFQDYKDLSMVELRKIGKDLEIDRWYVLNEDSLINEIILKNKTVGE